VIRTFFPGFFRKRRRPLDGSLPFGCLRFRVTRLQAGSHLTKS
jgi:hypothetical protein